MPARAPRTASAGGASSPVIIALVFVLIALVWSTTWFGIKVSLLYLPPFFSLSVRFFVAAGIILVIMAARRVPIPWRLSDQPLFASVGVTSFIISYGVVYWGEQYITSGLTAVIFALLPLFTGVVAHFFLRRDEPLSGSRLLGLLVGLGGIVLINAADLEQFHPLAPLAGVLVILGPLATAFSSVISKRRIADYPAMAFASVPMLYGGAGHLVFWLVFERGRPILWTWQAIAATAYLTLLGSVVTFLGYYWLLGRISVNRLNTIAYITPIVALAVGYLGAGETLTPLMLAGSCLVLASVALSHRASR